MKTFRAVYDDNVLRPLDPVEFRQGQRIVVTGVEEEAVEDAAASVFSSEPESRTAKVFFSISGISPALLPDGDWQCRKRAFLATPDARNLLREARDRGELILLCNRHEFSIANFPMALARDLMPASSYRMLRQQAESRASRRRQEQLSVINRELEMDLRPSDFVSPLSEDERITTDDGQREPLPGITGVLPERGDILLVCLWLLGMSNERLEDSTAGSELFDAFSYVDLRIVRFDFL